MDDIASNIKKTSRQNGTTKVVWVDDDFEEINSEDEEDDDEDDEEEDDDEEDGDESE